MKRENAEGSNSYNSLSSRNEKQKRRFLLDCFIGVTFFLFLLLIILYKDVSAFYDSMSSNRAVQIFVELVYYCATLICLAVFTISLLQRIELHLEASREDTISEYQEKLRRDIVGDSVPDNALGRMLVNLEDIKEYYTWSQHQARSSFNLASALCVAGFLALIIAVFILPIMGLGIEASVILAIGGAITELMAGTALLVYRSSLSQLNYYHEALHEDERFLSSVNLVDRFSTAEKQDEILAEIVRNELSMNAGGSHNAIQNARISNNTN